MNTNKKNAFPGQDDEGGGFEAGQAGQLGYPTPTAASAPSTYSDQLLFLLTEVQHLRMGCAEAGQRILAMMDEAVVNALSPPERVKSYCCGSCLQWYATAAEKQACMERHGYLVLPVERADV